MILFGPEWLCWCHQFGHPKTSLYPFWGEPYKVRYLCILPRFSKNNRFADMQSKSFYTTSIPPSLSIRIRYNAMVDINKKSRIYGTSDLISALLICLKCTYIWGRSVHLRPIFSDWLRQITWENKLNLPQMYGILYIWGRFCTFEAEFLKRTALWLAQRWNRPQMYVHFTENLTFDSNSTCDRFYQMC